jgi:hypothetical protein
MLDTDTLELYLDIESKIKEEREAAEVRVLTQIADFPPATTEILIERRMPPRMVAELFLDCLSRKQ